LAHNDVLQQVEILVELIDLGWYARVHLRQHLLLRARVHGAGLGNQWQNAWETRRAQPPVQLPGRTNLLLDVVDVSLRVVRVLLNPVDLLRNLFL
jgi:hypothetical protein